MDDAALHSFRDEWYVRVFELQAVMELYYLEMLRCEERVKANEGSLRSGGPSRKRRKRRSDKDERQSLYPQLRIGPSDAVQPSAAADSKRKVLIISPSQAFERLVSPGSPIDSFVHPYLFASSEWIWVAEGPNGTEHEGDSERPEEVEGRAISALAEAIDVSCPSQSDSSVESSSTSTPNSADSPPLSTSPSIFDFVALGKRLLGLTPNLHNLSLTGIFQSAPTGVPTRTEDRPLCLGSLRSLTIGPSPAPGYVALRLTDWGLLSLRRLRLTNMLISHQLETVSGDNDGLPLLSQLQWSMVRKHEPANDGL